MINNKHWLITSSVFAQAFHKELEYRNRYIRVNSGDDAGKSCKHIMNFGSLTLEITLLICIPSYGYWTKISLFIRRAGIPKRVGRFECQDVLKFSMVHVHLL